MIVKEAGSPIRREECANAGCLALRSVEEVTEVIMHHSTEAARFLADAEEKIIARFFDIAGLGDEYKKAIDLSETSEFNKYALIRTLFDRGYNIDESYGALAPIDGTDNVMTWRMFLSHGGEEVAYNVIEIKIGTTKRTGYGAQMQ